MNNEITFETGQAVPMVESLIKHGMRVVDCGCYGWRLAECCSQTGAELIGVDVDEPPNRPAGVAFSLMVRGVIQMDKEYADLVVASHVLEHVSDPTMFFWELCRITRKNGMIWIEAPSELSAMPNGSDDAQDHSFRTFWDDPTHVRPWTPGALYRLALSCQTVPMLVSRDVVDGIPVVRMLCKKPTIDDTTKAPRYVSFRNVPPGIENAWKHVWGTELRS